MQPTRASGLAERRLGGPDLRRPVRAGLLIVLLFFGLFGGWAALAPLDSAAIAPGTIRFESKRRTIQHLEGGIIAEIRARDGDHVRRNDVLLRLDETRPRANLTLLRGRRMSARALRARLIAERDGLDEIAFDADLIADPSAEARQVREGQSGIFAARREALAGQRGILRQRVNQLQEEIAGLSAQIASEDRQLALIAEELADLNTLLEKGLARKDRLLALQRRQVEIEGNRAQRLAEIARARQGIGETDLRIVELDTRQLNDVVQELREIETRTADLDEQIRAAEDVLARTAVRAPADGIVVGSTVHTIGGVIAAGAQLMDLVPSRDALIIEARVDPLDIDVVHAGLPARVRLTAFNQRSTPLIDARVHSVSADRLEDARTGVSYYLGRITLDPDSGGLGAGLELYPGMPAEVTIVTGQRTFLDYLIAPLSRTLDRAFREQ